MKVRHKCILVKEIKNKDTSDIIGLNEVDHYEVCFVSDDITDIKAGDSVYFRAQEGRITFEGQEYIVVTDDNVKVIL